MSLLFELLPIESIGRWLFGTQRGRVAGRFGFALGFIVAFLGVEIAIVAYAAEKQLYREPGLLVFSVAAAMALVAGFLSAWGRQRTKDEVAEWERTHRREPLPPVPVAKTHAPLPPPTSPAQAAPTPDLQAAPDIFSLPPSAFEDRNRH
jgi:hypothetical protein